MRSHFTHGLFFSLFSSLLMVPLVSLRGATFHVSPAGNDRNPGTALQPFGTLARAQAEARRFAGREAVTVFLHRGTYYLNAPLVFTAADSGTKQAPVIYESAPGDKPVISGGLPLNLVWAPYKDGIFQARVPDDLVTDEIFVNGERQILARYPNFDANAQYFNGFSADAISKKRAARWADPAGGYFHAMHKALWGGFTWLITGKDANGEIIKEGGWQNNREGEIHEKFRFVENIFEELDAPGEWFLNRKTHTLYFYPPAGLDLRTAVVEATRLRTLVEFKGEENAPVRFVTLKDLTFRHAARTVMDTKEPLLRSDWTIYRGGAIFFEGAVDCALQDSLLDQPGGNAVFVNNYNRRITVRGCEIVKAGASGICFLGDPKSVRSPLFNYNQQHKLEELDRKPGPLTDNYPADCLVDDCLIHLTGRVEKQTAGVAIDIAQNITVRHCSIYDMPRAGINIGDGCFGGHAIEFCDVFDTVKETGDHGSFNSWGRDRFWRSDVNGINAWVKQDANLPLLDAVKPVTIRNSRWRCDHGWDIDLDDGSTNYVITNNLCLNGGIKNREGFHRIVENNVIANNSFHPHVWPVESGDVFRHNIVFAPYRPAIMPKTAWGQEMDYNLLHQVGMAKPQPAKALQAQSGRDEHSITGDALFVDPSKGDFRVREGSPALALGFKNFPTDQFGVQKPALKLLARTPSFNCPPQKQATSNAQDGTAPAPVNGKEAGGPAGEYRIKATFANPETCNFATRGIFIIWWDKQFDYRKQAEESLDTFMEVQKECVETWHMSDPPGPQAGYYYNIYLFNGSDLFKEHKWGMGQGTDSNGFPFLTLPLGYAKMGSPGIYHEGLHIFQYLAKDFSPMFTYTGDGKWIIEASANWNAARKHPGDKNDYLTAATITANPQLPMWYTYENREEGDEKLWQRFCHLYGIHTFLNYLTDVRKEPAGVVLEGFYAGTKDLPQEYMYHRIGGAKFADYFSDYAAHNVCGFPQFPAGVEERAARELKDHGTPRDFHAVVKTYADEGTGGAWVRPPKDFVTRGWSYNLYKIHNTGDATYTFQIKGDSQGSEGAPAEFRGRIVVRTGDAFRVEPLKMSNATDGSGSISVKASDAEVYLIVAATPPFFKGNQTYSYEVLIDRKAGVPATSQDPEP